VQFLPAPTPLVGEALAEARTVEVGKQKTRVFTAEHAVAVALQTNRATDRLKIEHLLESGREPLDGAPPGFARYRYLTHAGGPWLPASSQLQSWLDRK